MHTRPLFTTYVAMAAVATAMLAMPVRAGDAGVSVSVGEPGFYGRIDIGNAPAPRLVYRQPTVVDRTQGVEPIYLRVPPSHARHWRDHCANYNACGRPVYFVQEDWYNNVYAPHYRKQHGHGGGDDEHGEDHDHGHGHDH